MLLSSRSAPVLSLVLIVKSFGRACTWLEQPGELCPGQDWKAVCCSTSLLSPSFILLSLPFFLLHSYARLSAHCPWMAFCAWVFFPFSPFSTSLVKSNCNSSRRQSPIPMPLQNPELAINTGAGWAAGTLTPSAATDMVHGCSGTYVHVPPSTASAFVVWSYC